MCSVHLNLLRGWKKEFLERAGGIFDETKLQWESRQKEKDLEAEHTEMLKTIVQLTLERDWPKKKSVEIFGPDLSNKNNKISFGRLSVFEFFLVL